MATPKREQFANNAVDALNGAIDDTVTTLAVVDASAFPSDGNFRILIDSEIMVVTGVSTNTFTVVRGQEGTTAASHTDAAPVTHLVTAGSVGRLIRDSVPYGFESSRLPHGIYDANGNQIDSSDFTWVNQSTAVATDHGNFIHLDGVSGGSGTHFIRGLFLAAPSTPYSAIARLRGYTLGSASNIKYGMAFYESGTGKLTTFAPDGVASLEIDNWTSATVFSAAADSRACNVQLADWFKISDDGTNLHFYVSTNGINWVEVMAAKGRTSFFTTGPDYVGFFVSRHNNTSYQVGVDLLHWSFGS